MATKVHYKSYFPEHSEMINLNEDTGNSWRPFYLSNAMNERFNNGCIPNPLDRYSKFDKEMLKQTMLEHEAIFRKQVYELHRLYSIQKTLMGEFLNNGSFKFFKLKDSSKETLCSSEVQSEWARRMLQVSPQPGTSSIQQRERAREISKNNSPTMLHKSMVQCSFRSIGNKDQQKAAESNTRFGKGSKRTFDLELPADAYIDDAERLHDIQVSPSVNPCFRISKENVESKLRLKLTGANGFNGRENCKIDYNDSGSLFSAISEVNKPKKQMSSPTEFFDPVSQSGECLGHNFSLRSAKICLESVFSNVGDYDRGTSGKVIAEVEQKAQEVSSVKNEAGKNCLARSASLFFQKEKHPMLFEPIHLERNVNERILTDSIEKSMHIGQGQGNGCRTSEEFPRQSGLDNSAKQTSMMPNFFPSPSKLDISMALPKVPTWRKPSGGVPISTLEGPEDNGRPALSARQRKATNDLEGKREDFKLGLSQSLPVCEPLDTSCCSSQVDLGYRKMGGGSERQTKEEASLPSSNLKAFPSTMLAKESSSKLTYNSNVRMSGGTVSLINIQSTRSSSNQHSLVVNELEKLGQSCDGNPHSNEKSLSLASDRSKSRKLIDLNYEFPFIDEPESGEFNATSLPVPKYSDPVLVSDAVPLQKDATHDTLITEAATKLIELSLDTYVQKDATTLKDDALDWFAEVILSNTMSTSSNAVGDCCPEVSDDDSDLFELMTLKLEEMKPELPCCRAREVDGTSGIEHGKSAILLGKARRAQGKKRRQKKDFQKDVLPGLATLSRQEAMEDLQTIGELMKESGLPLQVMMGRRATVKKAAKPRPRRRQKPRTAAVAFTVVRLGSPSGLFMAKDSADVSEYKVEGKHVLGWGSKTRRCRSQRCSPIRTSTTLT